MRYTPVGECIYSGEKDEKPTDEHIVAFALGGECILPKASCEACQALASKAERAALHDMLIEVRAQLGLPSRKKSLPDKTPLVVHYGDKWSRACRSPLPCGSWTGWNSTRGSYRCSMNQRGSHCSHLDELRANKSCHPTARLRLRLRERGPP